MLRSVAGSIFFVSQCAAALSSTADMLVRNCTKMGAEVLYMEIVMECGSFAGGRSGNLASIGGTVTLTGSGCRNGPCSITMVGLNLHTGQGDKVLARFASRILFDLAQPKQLEFCR